MFEQITNKTGCYMQCINDNSLEKQQEFDDDIKRFNILKIVS